MEFPTLTGILIISTILLVFAFKRKLTYYDMYTFTFFVTMLYMMSPYALIGLVTLPISIMVVKNFDNIRKILLLTSSLTPITIYTLEIALGLSYKLLIITILIELIFMWIEHKKNDPYTKMFTTYMKITTPVFMFPSFVTPYIQYISILLFPIYIKLGEHFQNNSQEVVQ